MEHMDSIMSVLAVLAPALFALVAGTGWYRERRARGLWWTTLLDRLADSAVAKQEATFVQPYKARNDLIKLPTVAQAKARDGAITEIMAVAERLSPELAALPIGEIAQAVEAAVRRAKAKLPDASLAKFPGWLLAVGLCGMMAAQGCATIPADWEQSNADDMEAVAEAADVAVFANMPDDPHLLCMYWAGKAGERTYSASADAGDKNSRLKLAAIAAQECAQTLYPHLVEAGLPAMIRERLGIRANDTDQLLGVILAAIRAEARPKLYR